MNQHHTNSEMVTPQLNSLPAGYSILSFKQGNAGMQGNGQFVRGTGHESITQYGKKPYYNLTLRLLFPVGKNGLTIAFFLAPQFDVQNYFNLQLNLSNMKANEQVYQTEKIPFIPGGTGLFVMSRVVQRSRRNRFRRA